MYVSSDSSAGSVFVSGAGGRGSIPSAVIFLFTMTNGFGGSKIVFIF
jgi:hypothetical protein